jgi:RNA recognition motif-containing protein
MEDAVVTVFVGNLPTGTTEGQLRAHFERLVPEIHIVSADVRSPAGPHPYSFFGFVTVRSTDDATAVIRAATATRIGERLITVELARRCTAPAATSSSSSSSSAPTNAIAPSVPSAPTELSARGFRVEFSGLPQSYTWQRLKDAVRDVARPHFAHMMRPSKGCDASHPHPLVSPALNERATQLLRFRARERRAARCRRV